MSTEAKISKRKLRRRRESRHKRGFSLVEILVSIVITATFSLIFFSLVASMAELSTASKNEIYANHLGQQLLNGLTAKGYDYLSANMGTVTLHPNGLRSYIWGTPLAKAWKDETSLSQFKGTATYTIAPGPGAALAPDGQLTSLATTVTLTWSDNVHTQPYQRVVAKVIHKDGINKWTP